MEATPLVIGNTMIITSTYGQVIALDATTGAEKWKFALPDNDMPVGARLGLFALCQGHHLRLAAWAGCIRWTWPPAS